MGWDPNGTNHNEGEQNHHESHRKHSTVGKDEFGAAHSEDRLDQFKRAFRAGLGVLPLLEFERCCLLHKHLRESL